MTAGGRPWAAWLNRLGPLFALILVLLLFAVLVRVVLGENRFATPGNIETILRQTIIVGMAALGMTLIIVSGGIDLSAGSVVALAGVVLAALMKFAGWGPLSAALAGVAAGAACGLVNGLLVTQLRVVPFIITLGTLLVFRGTALGIADNRTITPGASWLDHLTTHPTGDRAWMLIPPGVWILLFFSLLVAGFMKLTVTGRHTFAVGANEKAARLSGVPIAWVRVIVYTLGGVFAGLAGVLQYTRLSQGDPTGATGMELQVIAAVVIGGGSLSGGEGSVLGTLVGALIMSSIANGCSILGIESWVQMIVTGVVIIVAVAVDRLRHRRTE